MRSILFDEYQLPFDPAATGLEVSRLSEIGPRLDVAYGLLRQVFDEVIVEPKRTYLEMLVPDGLAPDGFRALCTVAAFPAGDAELIAGFLSANLMGIDRSRKSALLAIGNIATSPALRRQGFKGVGTALCRAAVEFAQREVADRQSELAYLACDAEVASIEFWRKLDYLQPLGLQYLQPPLEFDADGRPIHPEVPETLLVCPQGKRSRQSIDAMLLRDMIRAMYRNWSLETNRSRLSTSAFRAAESYVMERVFPRVAETIVGEEIPLAIPRSF